jgi:hypothetical protein
MGLTQRCVNGPRWLAALTAGLDWHRRSSLSLLELEVVSISLARSPHRRHSRPQAHNSFLLLGTAAVGGWSHRQHSRALPLLLPRRPILCRPPPHPHGVSAVDPSGGVRLQLPTAVPARKGEIHPTWIHSAFLVVVIGLAPAWMPAVSRSRLCCARSFPVSWLPKSEVCSARSSFLY